MRRHSSFLRRGIPRGDSTAMQFFHPDHHPTLISALHFNNKTHQEKLTQHEVQVATGVKNTYNAFFFFYIYTAVTCELYRGWRKTASCPF